MESEVHSFYGNKVRIRVCGICIHTDKILLVNHAGITASNFWAPPGGGLNFGETAHQRLMLEFKEETGIDIEVKEFMFACELIKQPLHAIELFFKVIPLTMNLMTGTDPEPGSPSVIKEVKFMSWSEVEQLPSQQLHGAFGYASHPSKIDQLQGYFKL